MDTLNLNIFHNFDADVSNRNWLERNHFAHNNKQQFSLVFFQVTSLYSLLPNDNFYQMLLKLFESYNLK